MAAGGSRGPGHTKPPNPRTAHDLPRVAGREETGTIRLHFFTEIISLNAIHTCGVRPVDTLGLDWSPTPRGPGGQTGSFGQASPPGQIKVIH